MRTGVNCGLQLSEKGRASRIRENAALYLFKTAGRYFRVTPLRLTGGSP